MTPPPRNRRRRGRRGARQQPDGQQEQRPEQQVAQEQGTSIAPSGLPRRPRPEGRRDDGGQQVERSDRQAGGARKRSRGKRRPNQRPLLGPMPTEVLKEPFREVQPTRPMERLELDEVFASVDDGLQFGCPMLTRTRVALPIAGNHPSPRCSMGWALHSEQEVALCLRTPDLLDCWKLDAQREERLRAELNEESAAD